MHTHHIQAQHDALLSKMDAAISRRLHGTPTPVTLSVPFGAAYTDSSIAVPLFVRDGQLHVRMTQRPTSMRAFAGEWVFPGGKRDGFESSLDTARREYVEELGQTLDPGQIRGQLCDLYRTAEGGRCFRISPVLCEIDPLATLNPNAEEVGTVMDIAVYPPTDETRAFATQLGGATRVIIDVLTELGADILADFSASQKSGESSVPLRMVVTSGGTRVPVDTVRVMTNESAGTTGALIAEQAMIRGHLVHYLCSKDTKTPFQENLVLNPQKPLESELTRVSLEAPKVFPLMAASEVEKVKNFDSYRRRLLELCANAETDVVILAMAASDYAPVPTDGKISSDKDELTLTLKPLPKVISEVKRERPDIFLVGFKLLVNQPPDALIDVAYRSMLRDHQDLAVANVGANSMRPNELLTYIVTGERGVIPVKRDELDQRLCSIIEERFSRRHFRTELTKQDSLPLPQRVIDEFLSSCHSLAKLALFDKYTTTARAEFGFLASRTELGTLITGRGSSKSGATADDLALVRDVDLKKLSINVTSTGTKAALNASIAHLIFKHRPEVNYIVHTHISLPEAIRVPRDSSPSTAEDWERMEGLVKAGYSIIEQPHHGVCILLQSLDELPEILTRNSIYHSNADHYDHAYHRFLDSPTLVDLLSKNVSTEEPILDLCSGTGEVSRDLLMKGFSNLTLYDRSEQMNAVAQEKLQRLVPSDRILTGDVEKLSFDREFGGIIMRQAVNYIAPKNLVATFKRIGAALKPGGLLVFNSFVLDESFTGNVVHRREEVGNTILRTCEGNLVKDKLVLHGQKTEIFDAITGDYRSVYDLNSFWSYHPSEFEEALRMAGATSITTTREGNSVYFECRW